MALSRTVILPYKIGSRSAKLLAEGLSNRLRLKVRRVRADGKYRPKQRSLIINYGLNQPPNWLQLTRVNQVLNHPTACAKAGNKLLAFQAFKQANVETVEWTTDKQQAQQWTTDGATVVCRTLLNAHSGRGIHLATSATEVVPCQLYTKYKKKKKEFRVHIFRGVVVDVAEKRRRNKADRPEHFDGYIRNHGNGWVFCRDNITRPDDLDQLAIGAVRSLGLDFGAVDIIWNERDNKSYVLEVNTAPGVEGTTLEKYTQVFYNWIQEQR